MDIVWSCFSRMVIYNRFWPISIYIYIYAQYIYIYMYIDFVSDFAPFFTHRRRHVPSHHLYKVHDSKQFRTSRQFIPSVGAPRPKPSAFPGGAEGKKTPSESETARRWRLENQGCSAVQWVQRKDGSWVPTVPITTVTIRWISRLGISHYIIPFGWRVADFLKPRLGMVYCCTTLP